MNLDELAQLSPVAEKPVDDEYGAGKGHDPRCGAPTGGPGAAADGR